MRLSVNVNSHPALRCEIKFEGLYTAAVTIKTTYIINSNKKY